jgi:hypothetical protein
LSRDTAASDACESRCTARYAFTASGLSRRSHISSAHFAPLPSTFPGALTSRSLRPGPQQHRRIDAPRREHLAVVRSCRGDPALVSDRSRGFALRQAPRADVRSAAVPSLAHAATASVLPSGEKRATSTTAGIGDCCRPPCRREADRTDHPIHPGHGEEAAVGRETQCSIAATFQANTCRCLAARPPPP